MRKFTFATRILIVIAMYLQSSAWQWWRPALVVTPTGSWKGWTVISGGDFHLFRSQPEVEFVHPVSPGGSVKFLASGVNFSIFTHFLCFFLLKLLKLGEIDGVKFLAWKSGGVKFWTNSMSDHSSTSKDRIAIIFSFTFHSQMLLLVTYHSACLRCTSGH